MYLKQNQIKGIKNHNLHYSFNLNLNNVEIINKTLNNVVQKSL